MRAVVGLAAVVALAAALPAARAQEAEQAGTFAGLELPQDGGERALRLEDGRRLEVPEAVFSAHRNLLETLVPGDPLRFTVDALGRLQALRAGPRPEAPPPARPAAPPPRAEQALVIVGALLHTGDGKTIRDGAVLVVGQELVAVGPRADVERAAPPGARVLAFAAGELTPGLIDAASTAGVVSPDSWAEHETEVVPHLRVLDEVDLHAPVWRRLVARGVTTVCVTASPDSVIGSRTAIVRTAGPLRARVVSQEGAVKATLGPETWRRGAANRRPFGTVDHMARRPTTRMGAVFVFREAMAKAQANQLPGPAGEVLRQVLSGDVPLRFQARTRGDIETVLRLADEAGLRPILEEATEIHHVLDLVKARGLPVIFGPVFDRPRGWRAWFGEADHPALATAAMLHAAGVPFCLTAADREDEDDLRAQAMMAARYGLDPTAALTAITGAPAALLRLDRSGVLATGRDADVVVWSGPPLEPTSRPVLVVVQGQVVVEPEAAPAAADRPARRAAPPATETPPPQRPRQRF